MKKIKVLLALIIIFMPICIKAFSYENYNKSIKSTNRYINRFTDRNKYLIFNKPYVYYSGASLYRMPGETETDFKYGGLLSYDEYNISKGKYSSYLAIGRDYWTLTPYESEQYYIDNTVLHKARDLKAGVRVTQFVKPSVVVDGSGTYARPWVFSDRYNLTIKVEKSAYGAVSASDKNDFNSSLNAMVNPGTKYLFKIKEKDGYIYKSSDCSITHESNESNGVYLYRTQSIKKDTICTINYEKRQIKVKYNCGDGGGTAPATVTLNYGQSYSIADYACSKKGYNQVKWKTSNGYEWTKGETGVSTLEKGARGLINDVLTLEPVWEAKVFTVKYDGNGGKWNGNSTWSETVTYGSQYKVQKRFFTKSGSSFVKWTDPTGVTWAEEWQGQWTYDNGDYGITNNTLVLTAQWKDVCSKEHLTLCSTTQPCRTQGITSLWDSAGNKVSNAYVCNGYTLYSFWGGNNTVACNSATKFYILEEVTLQGQKFYHVCFKYKDAGPKEYVPSNPSSGTWICDYYFGYNCSKAKWGDSDCNVAGGCTG